MNAETTPAAPPRRRPPGTRYVRPSDVRTLKMQLELGYRVLRVSRDHFGPGKDALMLVLEEVPG